MVHLTKVAPVPPSDYGVIHSIRIVRDKDLSPIPDSFEDAAVLLGVVESRMFSTLSVHIERRHNRVRP